MVAIDPEEMVRGELAAAMIPTPEDVMEDLSPLAGLFYLEQLGWAVLTSFTAYAQEQLDAEVEGADDLSVTLSQIGAIVGMLDGTCARIGLIPPEAVPPPT